MMKKFLSVLNVLKRCVKKENQNKNGHSQRPSRLTESSRFQPDEKQLLLPRLVRTFRKLRLCLKLYPVTEYQSKDF